MVNQTMQAKALKLKRQKRLFPKKYCADYISVGGGPEKQVMNEYKERARSLAFDDAYIKHLEAKQRFNGVPAGRFEVLLQLKLIESNFGEDFQFVVLVNSPEQKVQLFYTSDKTAFSILVIDFKAGIASLSMKYQDRQRCIDIWKDGRLRWIHQSPLSPG